VRGDEVFASCGWGTGAALLRVSRGGAGMKVEEVYRVNAPFEAWRGSSVRLGERVHGTGRVCLDWKTGERQDSARSPPAAATQTCADGRLIFRTGGGEVALVEVAADGRYVKRGEFKGPAHGNEPGRRQWSPAAGSTCATRTGSPATT
jgi:hypothetical protein